MSTRAEEHGMSSGSHRDPAGPPAEPRRLRPRTGPIVWGAIFLAFCVYVAAQTAAPGSVDTTTFVIASVIGLGALLLAVGVAVLARNARHAASTANAQNAPHSPNTRR